MYVTVTVTISILNINEVMKFYITISELPGIVNIVRRQITFIFNYIDYYNLCILFNFNCQQFWNVNQLPSLNCKTSQYPLLIS